MAAALKRSLGVEPEMLSGAYGEFAVLVEGQTLMTGGPLAFVGLLPTPARVVEAVRERLGG